MWLSLFSSFMINMMIEPNILVWNCRGAAKRSLPSFIKDLRSKHGFSILVLLEARVSGEKADNVVKRLNFDGIFRVEANGFAGGI